MQKSTDERQLKPRDDFSRDRPGLMVALLEQQKQAREQITTRPFSNSGTIIHFIFMRVAISLRRGERAPIIPPGFH